MTSRVRLFLFKIHLKKEKIIMAESTPNTLTDLIPTLYQALDVVSRELVGLIPSVTRDSQLARAAIGQTVYSSVAPAATAGNVKANVTPPDDGQQSIGNISLAITKSRYTPIRWQGEESLQMNSPGGIGVRTLMRDQFAQGMRTLCNEIESDLAGLYVKASRAVAPKSSTIFSTDLTDAANILKVLLDNGAPTSELKLVVGTTEGAALRSLAKLTTTIPSAQDMATQGVLINAAGFQIRESAQIEDPTIGTAAATATVSTAAHAVGATTINLASAGSGNIAAGDIISIDGDENYYVVVTGDADVSGGGTLVIAEPGLRVAITAEDSPAISVYKKSNRNMAFARSAIVLATRMPALPEGGDMGVDRTTITDPRSGLSFEVSKYLQYRQVRYEIAIAWGVACTKSEHLAILAG
jgi:hypothetical protein